MGSHLGCIRGGNAPESEQVMARLTLKEKLEDALDRADSAGSELAEAMQDAMDLVGEMEDDN